MTAERNLALVYAFLYMKLIEAWGSGIPNLIKAMREYGLRELEFLDMEIGFRRNTKESSVPKDTIQATDQETSQYTNSKTETKSTKKKANERLHWRQS